MNMYAIDLLNRDAATYDRFNRGYRSLYDRGRADSYYMRGRSAHYIHPTEGEIKASTPEEFAEYNAGFDDNQANGDHKDYT